MNAPEIRPRGMNLETAPSFAVQQARAYNTLLDTVNHLTQERNRFDTEADRERWRRLRAERALRYAHRWCGGLMAVIVILGFAVVVLVGIR